MTRRDLLAASTASLALPSLVAANPARKRVLRVAHLTDIHVQPEKSAGPGMAACLRHAQSQKDKPDLILTGGDLIMDAFAASYDRTKAQWDLFVKVLKDETSIPVEHCIGNHDVWGWSERESNPAHKMLSSKKWALDVLGLDKPYRAFDRAGWKFVVLDSTHPAGNGYTAKLDEEQFDWLKSTLAATPKTTPVLIVSHIPILSASVFLDGENEKSGDWKVPGAWMHIDMRRIKDLFKEHPNVKAAVSGHLHLVDRVEYHGVSYLCNGAVCGAWWGGNYHECEPGYAMVNLFDDGTVEREYVPFGWKSA